MSRERRHVLAEEDELAEPGHFGCAMLTCNNFVNKSGRPVKSMRCSLGWALRTELDFARCRATAVSSECWKLHPEHAPVVAVPGADEGAVAHFITKIAGD